MLKQKSTLIPAITINYNPSLTPTFKVFPKLLMMKLFPQQDTLNMAEKLMMKSDELVNIFVF